MKIARVMYCRGFSIYLPIPTYQPDENNWNVKQAGNYRRRVPTPFQLQKLVLRN